MRATKFEFEQRFWFIGLIFWLGFSLYAVDRTNAALWLLHVAAPSVDPHSDHGNNLTRLIFGCGALLVFLAAAFRTRIELRQIRARDQAKLQGGLGPCGKTLCCSSWIADFGVISIKMAHWSRKNYCIA